MSVPQLTTAFLASATAILTKNIAWMLRTMAPPILSRTRPVFQQPSRLADEARDG